MRRDEALKMQRGASCWCGRPGEWKMASWRWRAGGRGKQCRGRRRGESSWRADPLGPFGGGAVSQTGISHQERTTSAISQFQIPSRLPSRQASRQRARKLNIPFIAAWSTIVGHATGDQPLGWWSQSSEERRPVPRESRPARMEEQVERNSHARRAMARFREAKGPSGRALGGGLDETNRRGAGIQWSGGDLETEYGRPVNANHGS